MAEGAKPSANSVLAGLRGPRGGRRTSSESSDQSSSSEPGPATRPVAKEAEDVTAKAAGAQDVLLYDKYLAKFFNPLHSVPYASSEPSQQRIRGVLYDVDGKFGYTTYSEQTRSYHPMIDIRKYTEARDKK